MIGSTCEVKRNSLVWRDGAWLPPWIAQVWGYPAGSCQARDETSCRIHVRIMLASPRWTLASGG